MANDRNNKWAGKKFKVTVHLPERLSESVRQAKIDRLYDILKPVNGVDCKNIDEVDDDNKNNNKSA